MNRVVFMDIETSGLDPTRNQTLEVGAVLFQDGVVRSDFYCHFYMNQELIAYDADALRLFGDRIKDRRVGIPVIHVSQAERYLRDYLVKIDANKLTFGGKNFGAFDKGFIEKWFPSLMRFVHYRSVDIGNKYERRDDDKMPDLETCRQRALKMGITGIHINNPVQHTALEDACLCAELYAGWWNNKSFNDLLEGRT